MLRYLLIILLAVSVAFIVSPGSEAFGQVEGDTSSAGTGPTGPVTFDEPTDLSLFVGHYRLNPGDTIRIEVVTGEVDGYTPMIDDEGYIALPVIGRVMVADLTTTEARETIQEIADKYYRNAWITVRITQIAKVKFYIYGDVNSPGFYTAPGSTTFFDFLQKFNLANSAAHRRIVHVKGDINAALPEPMDVIGGDRETSSELIAKSLELFESGKIDQIDPKVTVLDPLDFTLEGEIDRNNFYLEYGDVIYVPDPVEQVNVEGFRRSGSYEVLPGESWADIIRLAGEPTHLRDMSNIMLERRDVDGKLEQLYYNLNLLNDEELANLPMRHRDILRAVNYDYNVYVMGEVTTAGAYAYNSLSNPLDYVTLAGGPTEQAHLRFVKIVRPSRVGDNYLEDSEVFDVDLVEAINNGAPIGSTAIQPGDIIYVPDKGEEITVTNMLSGLSILVNAIRLFD